MHPRNTIVIPCNESHNIFSYQMVFKVKDVVDAGDMQSDTCENRFPACYRVRSDLITVSMRYLRAAEDVHSRLGGLERIQSLC